jgi:hypothetical protein
MAMTKTDSVDPGDLFTIFKLDESDYRAATLAAVLAWLQASLTFPAGYTTQYASPSATAFNVAVSDSNPGNVHLILTPAAGYADGTITLPPAQTTLDGEMVTVNCTQSITTLVVAGNGATVVGAPAALTANAFFTLKYDLPSAKWYRVA